MALGTRTNYGPAEKRVDREERRTLMLNYKSAAVPDVIREGKPIEVLKKSDTSQRIVLAAPIAIGGEKYYMGVMLLKVKDNQRLYLHDVVTEKAPAEGGVSVVTNTADAAKGERFLTDILREALNVKSEDIETSGYSSDVAPDGTVLTFDENKNAESTPQPNSPLRAKKPIDSASKDKIAQEDADVKSENAIKDSRMASQDEEFNKKLEEAGMAYDGETGTILHSRMYSTGQENAARVNRSKLVGMIADRLVKEGGMTREAAYARADSFVRAEEAAALF